MLENDAVAADNSASRESNADGAFPLPNWYPAARIELEKLRGLKKGWDSYGAEAPNSEALGAANEVVEETRRLGIPLERIVPSAEGGVAITFTKGKRYADIECFNDGQLMAVVSDREHDPVVWQVDASSIEGSLERIREFLRS